MVYQDISIWGYEKSTGQALEYFSADAVKNALQLWLATKKGEYLMNPLEGGALDKLVFKNLNEKQLSVLRFQLQNALNKDFYPQLRIRAINFIPDFNNRILEVQIYYTILETGISDNVSLFTNSTYAVNNFEYEDVDMIGENLYQFFVLKKPSMLTKRLVFDNDGAFWRWGQYKLINLTPTDPYFTQILEIANGS